MINWLPTQPTLDAGPILLRPLQESDVDAIYDSCQDPLISQFTRIPSPYDRDMAVDFVRGSHFTYLDHISLAFAIEYRGDESQQVAQFAGTVGLHSLQQGDHMGEVGYWMDSKFRGKGICTLAVRTLIDFAFSEMQFRRIEGLTDTRNLASQKVLEAAGFTRDAILKNRATRPDGSQVDMVLYSKVNKG